MRIVVAGATGAVGRHVVVAGRERGHEVVGMSRSSGQDVIAGTGLREALAGADVVIDVTSVMTTSGKAAVSFFRTATRNLLTAEQQAGVGHHVALSIVGIDGIDAAYYAGKHAQEREVAAGDVPWSLLRAAQFHEFAEQMLRQLSFGPLTLAPKMLMRPVAAREVAAALVEVAEAGPSGRVPDLVGPTEERLVDLVRRLRRADGRRGPTVEMRLPGAYGRGLASGALRGGPDARRGTIDFDGWLRSADHRRR
ncbi:NAD(P)H-binding protein [Microbacterium oryzae]|uniref:SDR family oxidoreductase n=1 Tax=Microbacterium oryzae TaxID=743009 RepID=UPI0025B27D40|nr:NAD(P)H-binding protein [Microbacterium oryzae]MDN3310443.1 NAD(P)H-binding protein [Microbacterium oryzae]